MVPYNISVPHKTIRIGAWSLAGLGIAVLLGVIAWLMWRTPPPLHADADPQHHANTATTRTWVIAGGAVLAALGLTLAGTSRNHSGRSSNHSGR
jgi:hypothetical protein